MSSAKTVSKMCLSLLLCSCVRLYAFSTVHVYVCLVHMSSQRLSLYRQIFVRIYVNCDMLYCPLQIKRSPGGLGDSIDSQVVLLFFEVLYLWLELNTS